jgi:beta-glucanase (GH16 family)
MLEEHLSAFVQRIAADRKALQHTVEELMDQVDEMGYVFSPSVTWGDEFNYTGTPDPTKWTLMTGNGYTGWGNNEKQYFTERAQNVVVADNRLKITAIKEAYEGFEYTSGKLNSRNGKMFQYGRFQIRAKLPMTGGMWSAFFLFGQNQQEYFYGSWPEYGEIDIMELNGNNPGKMAFNQHSAFEQLGGNFDYPANMNAGQFNDYRIDWTPEYFRWYMNDVQYFEYTKKGNSHTQWPFDDYMFLLLCLNVGGNFTGAVDDSVLPQSIEIDHVRYYPLLGNVNTPIETIPAPIVDPNPMVFPAGSEFGARILNPQPNTVARWYTSSVLVYEGDEFTGSTYYPAGTYYLHVAFESTLSQRISAPTPVTLILT